MLPAWKRRILANFTAALTYSKPGHGHYGRTKVCMRQLVGCVTCARVDWIDEFVPCYLFKDCPGHLLAKNHSDSEVSTDTDDPLEEKNGRDAKRFSETTQGITYAVLQLSTLSLMSGNTARRGL